MQCFVSVYAHMYVCQRENVYVVEVAWVCVRERGADRSFLNEGANGRSGEN